MIEIRPAMGLHLRHHNGFTTGGALLVNRKMKRLYPRIITRRTIYDVASTVGRAVIDN